MRYESGPLVSIAVMKYMRIYSSSIVIDEGGAHLRQYVTLLVVVLTVSAFVCLVVCNLLLCCCSTAVAVLVADCDTDGIGLENALSTPCLFVEVCKHIITSCSSVVTHVVGELG